MTGSGPIDAERAFTRAARARRRAALLCRLRGMRGGRLRVYDEGAIAPPGSGPVRGIREIPLDAITGTLEPSRVSMFDCAFRPTASARHRWQRLWLAEHRGHVLPPISVVRTGSGYAVRDGHHRVSVAKARGALCIDATVDAVQAA